MPALDQGTKASVFSFPREVVRKHTDREDVWYTPGGSRQLGLRISQSDGHVDPE